MLEIAIYEWVRIVFLSLGAIGTMLAFGCIVGSMIRHGGHDHD